MPSGVSQFLLAAIWVGLARSASQSQVVGHVSVNVHNSEQGDHQRQVPAFAHDDGAQAAFRFCAETGISDLNSLRNVAKDLQRMIDQKEHEKVPGSVAALPCRLRLILQVDYKLRTAGAYSRRAEEHSKNGRYIEAGADLTRALLRPGLDEDQSQKLHQRLQRTMSGSRRQMEREEKIRIEEQEERERAAEEAAMVKTSQARAAEQQQYWDSWLADVSSGLELGADSNPEDPVADLGLTITKGNGEQSSVHLRCCDERDEHVRMAAVRFCMRHGLYNAAELTKVSGMVRKEALKADAEYDLLEGPKSHRLGTISPSVATVGFTSVVSEVFKVCIDKSLITMYCRISCSICQKSRSLRRVWSIAPSDGRICGCNRDASRRSC